MQLWVVEVGDTGVIETANGKFIVEDTIKPCGGKFGHVGYGIWHDSKRETVSESKWKERKDIEKNHSATHLLQKALKEVLGSHVEQKGSLVTAGQTSVLTFAHFTAMTAEEIE